MGDVPPPSGSPNDHLGHKTLSSFQEPVSDEGQASYVPSPNPTNPGFQSEYQHQFESAHNALSTQFNMTQPQGTGRGASQGPYNMSTMANALPQSTFRLSANNPGQMRYNPDGSASNAAPQMTQYAGQSNMNHLAGQPYYVAQPTHMPQYYTTQMPPMPQQGMSPRHNMHYYANQVMMNHAQQSMPPGYYYPQSNHYPSQSSPMPGSMITNHYMPHDTRGHSGGSFTDQSSTTTYSASQGGFTIWH